MRVLSVLMLLLASCSSGISQGPDPLAGHGFRAVIHVEGKAQAQAFIEAAPLTALFKVSGNYDITVRAFPPPYLVYDGTSDLIVEPVVGQEQQAVHAVVSGQVLIRRNGVPGALNAPGSIR